MVEQCDRNLRSYLIISFRRLASLSETQVRECFTLSTLAELMEPIAADDNLAIPVSSKLALTFATCD